MKQKLDFWFEELSGLGSVYADSCLIEKSLPI